MFLYDGKLWTSLYFTGHILVNARSKYSLPTRKQMTDNLSLLIHASDDIMDI